jgi:hypothetical protein
MLVVALAGAVALCAASASAGSRRTLGEGYAQAFSDPARDRLVTWDDRACTFTEEIAEATELTGAPPTQVSVIPAAEVTVVVRSRTARAGTLDVTFRCDPPALRCIARMRRFGSTVTSADRLTEHTLPLRGTIASAPRVSADFGALRAACATSNADGGAR